MVSEEDILFEDLHYIVLNKRAGDLVQGDREGNASLDQMIKDFLVKKKPEVNEPYLGVAHRLDRPVSGIVLFAKTAQGLERMNKLFKSRDVHKVYWAVVRKGPEKPEGKLVHWLTKDTKKNVSKAFQHEVKGSLRAELTYKVLTELNGYFLLEIELITGRHHQIRAQLSAFGCPIVGDNKYGYPRGSSKGSICLHARRLDFLHPIKNEPISIRAKLPEDGFWERFENNDY